MNLEYTRIIPNAYRYTDSKRLLGWHYFGHILANILQNFSCFSIPKVKWKTMLSDIFFFFFFFLNYVYILSAINDKIENKKDNSRSQLSYVDQTTLNLFTCIAF